MRLVGKPEADSFSRQKLGHRAAEVYNNKKYSVLGLNTSSVYTLCWSCLPFKESAIGSYFPFQMFGMVVLFGLFHGVIFLPVVLAVLDSSKEGDEIEEEESRQQQQAAGGVATKYRLGTPTNQTTAADEEELNGGPNVVNGNDTATTTTGSS